MKVYLTPPQPNRGLERIATALRKYAPPNVTIHTFPRNNDLTIIYAIGRRDAVDRQVEKILKAGKRYAIIQVCLKSTMSPDPWDWVDIWRSAEVVWSYYDLEEALRTGEYFKFAVCQLPNFYHAPLGADASVFQMHDGWTHKYKVLTSGLSRLSESVRECHLAAAEVNEVSCHLGAKLNLGDAVECVYNIDDLELSYLYGQCEFVSGLRRKEGFELPAVEGLLCGARPLVFDNPDWRWNYGPHAEYLQETDRQGVVDQLVELFKRGARPVSAEEREQAVERFNWKTIVEGFYERLG